MRVYVCHPKSINYLEELYKPLKESGLPVEFIFPHEEGSAPFNSKELFQNKKVDFVLAEVSQPATGQGIELGWADVYKIPIICIYKKGSKAAGSLKVITDKIIEYLDGSDLVNKLTLVLGLDIT